MNDAAMGVIYIGIVLLIMCGCFFTQGFRDDDIAGWITGTILMIIGILSIIWGVMLL